MPAVDLAPPPNGTFDDENGDQKAPTDQDDEPTLKRRDNDQP
jgi:hypothetical protein